MMKPEKEDAMRAKTIKKLETLNGVGEEIAGALYDAGFRTPTAVRIASDADLIGIAGIGEQNLEKIRAKDTATVKRKVGRREVDWNPHIGGPVVAVTETKIGEADAVVTADEAIESDGAAEAIVATQNAESPVAKPPAKEKK